MDLLLMIFSSAKNHGFLDLFGIFYMVSGKQTQGMSCTFCIFSLRSNRTWPASSADILEASSWLLMGLHLRFAWLFQLFIFCAVDIPMKVSAT